MRHSVRRRTTCTRARGCPAVTQQRGGHQGPAITSPYHLERSRHPHFERSRKSWKSSPPAPRCPAAPRRPTRSLRRRARDRPPLAQIASRRTASRRDHDLAVDLWCTRLVLAILHCWYPRALDVEAVAPLALDDIGGPGTFWFQNTHRCHWSSLCRRSGCSTCAWWRLRSRPDCRWASSVLRDLTDVPTST